MKKTKISQIVFIVYITILLYITVVRNLQFRGRDINLQLFVGYIPIIRSSIPRFIYLFIGNIIWFVPLGFYLAVYKRKPFWITILYGFLLSLFIETMQYVLGTGVSELDDLILNTLGCIIGQCAGACYLAYVHPQSP